MNFAINPVLGKTPKFVDLRLSTVNTADKRNSLFAPITRAEGLMGSSNCLTASHGIAEVTAERVSETKEYRNYIENSEFETKNIFEQKSI